MALQPKLLLFNINTVTLRIRRPNNMAMPKGFKHTEETKAKMRKPHKPITIEERKRRAERQHLYMVAREEFAREYVARKEKQNEQNISTTKDGSADHLRSLHTL
jgi:hypothetical protein